MEPATLTMGWSMGKIALGSIAAAIGATLILINSPWGLPRRKPFSVAMLEGAVLRRLDGSNREVKASELWKENGAVILAIRREAAEVSSLRPELDKLNVPLYGVVNALPGAEKFKKYVNGTLFYDEEKAFFDTSLRRQSLLGLFRLSVWMSLIRNSRAGYHGNLKGDGLLLGATLVIGKGDNPDIFYQHLSKEFGDHVDPQTVLEAAKKI